MSLYVNFYKNCINTRAFIKILATGVFDCPTLYICDRMYMWRIKNECVNAQDLVMNEWENKWMNYWMNEGMAKLKNEWIKEWMTEWRIVHFLLTTKHGVIVVSIHFYLFFILLILLMLKCFYSEIDSVSK